MHGAAEFAARADDAIRIGKAGPLLRRIGFEHRGDAFAVAIAAECDRLGGQSTYELGGSFQDGKGEPGQSNAVSHGCPAARFRQVNVLNTARK